MTLQTLPTTYTLLHLELRDTFSASEFELGWILSLQYIAAFFACEFIGVR